MTKEVKESDISCSGKAVVMTREGAADQRENRETLLRQRSSGVKRRDEDWTWERDKETETSGREITERENGERLKDKLERKRKVGVRVGGKEETWLKCVGVVQHVYKPAAYLVLLFPLKKLKAQRADKCSNIHSLTFSFMLAPFNHSWKNITLASKPQHFLFLPSVLVFSSFMIVSLRQLT